MANSESIEHAHYIMVEQCWACRLACAKRAGDNCRRAWWQCG